MEEVTVQLLTNEHENGIKISLFTPNHSLSALDSGKNQPFLYYWRHSDWGECEAVCGEGVERRQVDCVLVGGDGSPVSHVHCDPDTMPANVQTCHTESCFWRSGEWTQVGR